MLRENSTDHVGSWPMYSSTIIQTWIRQSGEDPKRQAVMMEVVLQDGPHADGLAGVVVQRP